MMMIGAPSNERSSKGNIASWNDPYENSNTTITERVIAFVPRLPPQDLPHYSTAPPGVPRYSTRIAPSKATEYVEGSTKTESYRTEDDTENAPKNSGHRKTSCKSRWHKSRQHSTRSRAFESKERLSKERLSKEMIQLKLELDQMRQEMNGTGFLKRRWGLIIEKLNS